MPYTDIIGRNDAAPLIPAEEARAVVTAAAQESAALALSRVVNMSSKVYSQPVLSVLPVAFWVPGDTGLKGVTKAQWEGIDLVAEEIACVVPCPVNVLNDSGLPIWTELRQPIANEFARKIDQALFGGVDKPASWPQALIPACTAAGNVNTADSTPDQGGIINDLGESLDDIEDDGFDATGYAAARSLRARLRQSRSTTGETLAEASMTSAWGLPIAYAVGDSIAAPNLAVAGDYSLSIVGIRQDMTYETFSEGVISDDAGVVVLNLMQQDSAALRVTMRLGWAVAVPATLAPASGAPFPFCLMTAPGA
jgi:HK97 family phage major capsid protein